MAFSNYDQVWVVGIISDYEVYVTETYKREEDARKRMFELAKRYMSPDTPFSNLDDAFDYERSDEWWDNDDRTVLIFDRCAVRLQNG
jgi:hypothetical protein